MSDDQTIEDNDDEGRDPEVEEAEDGSAVVTIDEDEPEGEGEFYDNLVDKVDASRLREVSASLVKLIEQDKEDRKKRDEKYAEGLRRTGLGDDAPGGAQFEGASRVVHPLMIEACVDFAARAMKEIFPASGPVKDMVVGEVTQKKLDKAHRKTKHMNRQLTVQMKEFRAELEQLLTQLPLGGGQFMKLYWDARKKRPVSLFVPIDEIYIPFAATSFASAERKTHAQMITQQEYESRVRSGMYRDADLSAAVSAPDQSRSQSANDKIEGRDANVYNDDGLRAVYEVYASLNVEGEEDDEPLPYIITIDVSSEEVLSLYRNWQEEDELREEMSHIVEWPFVPWRGAYPIGLPHMIGGLSGAATGALRALLDSAHIQNFPTLLKLKGGSSGGQSLNLIATGVTEIEGGLNVDDVRKLAMPVPFNPPSDALFKLLGFLVDSGRGVVRTTFENLADGANPNMPVGTTLALIEQGMAVFSAIHARLHAAMQRTLEVLHRLNRMHLDERVLVEQDGELVVRRDDYEGPVDVIPVSDPNIFSETQRFAQIQAIISRAERLPQLYDLRKVEEMFLKRLKVPEAEKLLLEKQEPKKMNAVNENIAASAGRPIVAFPEQEHLAHIQVHVDFLKSPMFGSSPIFAPKFIPMIVEHLKDHIALWYASHVFEITSKATGVDVATLMDKDEEVSREMDILLAAASPRVIQGGEQALSQLPPIIEQAMQYIQSLQPQQPQDPTLLAAEATKAETQRKAQADQVKAQLEAAKLADRDKDRQMDMAREQFEQQQESERTAVEVDARVGMNNADNQTARDLAIMEIASGERVAVSTGTGINPSP
jgi:hypothetical protein